jgi:hypothetical protein
MAPSTPTVVAPSSPPQAPPASAGFASLIIADIPVLFAAFRGKRFALLWRGSRDGFGARDFHVRCDGHAPTLTLIQDTRGTFSVSSRPWSDMVALVMWFSRHDAGCPSPTEDHIIKPTLSRFRI